MNWKHVLRDLPLDACIVEHQPFTTRYQRANSKLEYLLEHAEVLGARDSERPISSCAEIAVWAPEPTKRRPGYYACFRIYLEDSHPVFAVLYCFYDGRDQSPGFRSVEAATSFAVAQGFRHEDQDHR
jgi:hypothetical protein